jgi:hypothetical protein
MEAGLDVGGVLPLSMMQITVQNNPAHDKSGQQLSIYRIILFPQWSTSRDLIQQCTRFESARRESGRV